MASIHKKGDVWYIAYTDGSGDRHFISSCIPHSPIGVTKKDTKQKRKENKNKALIQAMQTEQLAQGNKRLRVLRKRCAAIINSARETEAEQSGVTFRSYFDDWTDHKLPDVGDSYRNQLIRSKVDCYSALEARADAELVLIDEEDIFDIVDHLEEQKLGGRSINKRLHILNEMFKDAEENAFVIINPVTEDHFKEESSLEKLPFTVEQNNGILAATSMVDWHTTTLFGNYCGMRLGDARSQIWEAINFERRVIIWVPAKTQRRRKQKAKVIVTPLHPVLYEHLVKVREMSGESPFVTPGLAERPVSNLSEKFVELVIAAKIDPIEITLPNGRIARSYTFHSERHGFATGLKRVGAPDKEWSMLTGHSLGWSRWNGEPISKVAQMYNHVDVEDRRKWIDLLPAVEIPQIIWNGINA